MLFRSALTQATLQDMCEHPHGHALAAQMMKEAQAVAEHLGITFRVPLDRRIEGARKVGKHKTSMLQDVEGGKSMEIDVLLTAVREIGANVGVATPNIDALLGLARLFARVKGLY